MKTDNDKQLLIEQLKKTPIIQVACEKIGIGRATFYRWKNEDREFAKTVEIAIGEGVSLINEMAESQLISSIKDKNFSAIAYWLNHRHPAYANKIEVTAKLGHEDEQLTPEQNILVMKALKLASVLPNNLQNLKKEEQK
ncbi:MAG: phBC6A51 family helix-turn-helix protein [Candidatus Shapirobacteria bacterium]|jgi:hypothetical protein